MADEADAQASVELLRALVAIPSVNVSMAPGSGGEDPAGDLVAAWGRAEGFRVTRQVAVPGRHNVLVDLGLAHLPTLALVTHLDTVPPGTLTNRARRVAYDGGRVYGRGACDAKGPLVAMLMALRRLRARRDELRCNVQVAALVDEEHTARGVLAYVAQHRGDTRPVAAIVGEPTGLDVVIAHNGVVRFRLAVHGRAAHSAQVADGINAIDKMADVLATLRAAFRARPPVAHPLLGAPTLTATLITGGSAVNVVPASCVATFDRRLLPSESAAAALAWLDAQLDALRARDPALQVEREEPFLRADGLETAPTSPIVRAVLSAHEAILGPTAPTGVPFGTDGSTLARRGGIPTVVCGPGQIAQAHTADEWIDVEQLLHAVDLYTHCAVTLAPAG